MSEELCYSTVVFTTPYNSSATVKRNEESIYEEVKKAEVAAETSYPAPEDSRTTGQESWSPAQDPQKTEHRYQRQHRAIVFLSLICAFLLAGIIGLFVCNYFSQGTAGQLKKDNSVLMEANHQLQELKSNLTAQKEFLENENKLLLKNQTLLNEILQFRNFPVEKYCSNERTCSPCPTGWIFNNSKCYFLYRGDTWETWEGSRLECIKIGADLLTIQNKEEQMFIMNLAPSYYDEWHGYWIGLTRQGWDWVWVNGSPLTTGFWADAGSQNGIYVLINTGKTTLRSWQSKSFKMLNRWICENKALLF